MESNATSSNGLKGLLKHPVKLGRLLKVVFDAAIDPECKTVSMSNTALLRLQLRQSFDAANFYPAVLSRAQFIFFGDSNHSDRSLHKFFYSQENVERLAAAGVRHVMPEMEPRYQADIDRLVTGEMSDGEFIVKLAKEAADAQKLSPAAFLAKKSTPKWLADIRDLVDGLHRIHEHGMRIHCLDDRSNISKDDIDDLFSTMRGLQDFLRERKGLPGIMHGKALLRYIIENVEEIQKVDNSIFSNVIAKRHEDDKALAERMTRAAGGEKTAILFGLGHAKSKGGLFDSLGRDKAIEISLYSCRELYADRIMQDRPDIEPDFVHILSEDKIYKFRGFKDLQPH